MIFKKNVKKIFDKWNDDSTFIILISISFLFFLNLAFNYWINGEIRTFSLDDYSLYISINVNKDGILYTGANKFRPVMQLIFKLMFYFIGHNYYYFNIINLGISFFISITVFFMTYKIQYLLNTNSKTFLALVAASLFIVSRFAYYNISELFGIMESLALWLSLAIIYFLIMNLRRNDDKLYFMASILYFIVIYVHERYIILITVFFVGLIAKNGFSLKKIILISYTKFILPFLIMVSWFLIRFFMFGSRALDGTGGTSAIETFSISNIMKFIFSQIFYLLGINAGDSYLSGINWRNVPNKYYFFIFVSIISVIWIITACVRLFLHNKELTRKYIWDIVLFITFITSCIFASSITIRVEMRWIYISYTAFVILLIYIYSIISESKEKISKLFLLIFLGSSIIFESFYRSNYSNLYYWEKKELDSSLYEATIMKYGDEFVDKEVYLVNAEDNWNEEEWKAFFRPFVEEYETLKFTMFNDVRSVPPILSEDQIVLEEDKEERKYNDITKSLKDYQVLQGVYDDGWLEQESIFNIFYGDYDNLELTLYYPKELTGDQNGKIYVNNEFYSDFKFENGNELKVNIKGIPNKFNKISVISDFYAIEDSGRSDKGTMACVLTDKKFIKEKKNNITIVSGVYEDAWVQSEYKYKIDSAKGVFHMRIECPFQLEAGSVSEIYVDNVLQQTNQIMQGTNEFQVPCETDKEVEITVKSNFEQQLDAPDTRKACYLIRDVYFE